MTLDLTSRVQKQGGITVRTAVAACTSYSARALSNLRRGPTVATPQNYLAVIKVVGIGGGGV
ncbi:MAG: hypothetical protein ABIP45_03075, partial [Knoellia sp.]